MKKERINLKAIIFAFLIIFLCLAGISRETYGSFKSWNYSQSEVFGLMKLPITSGRVYYKISAIDNNSTKIQKINPRGITVNTTVVTFSNGKLSMVTYTDQFGDTYEILKFTALGNDVFSVTDTYSGTNDILPCKSMKYFYINNFLSEIRYMSFSATITNNENGVAYVKYKRYDDESRYSLIKEVTYFDEDSKPVINKGTDYHKVVYERDARGNELSFAYYGIEGQPIVTRYGAFKSKRSYDLNDNEIETSSWGLNEDIITNAYGVAKTKSEYEKGLRTKLTYYDERNNIVKASDAGIGIAITKYEYDNNGNLTRTTYFDENANPANDHSGRQQFNYKYSALNMYIEEAYLDKSKTPVEDNDGIHKYTYVRDSKGRLIQQAFFDKNDLPVKNKHDDVYMIKYKYDAQGLKLSQSYWKGENTKMARWDGYHEYVFKYNEQGQATEYLSYDEKGNLFITEGGYSRTVTKYNANSKISEYSYFNGNTPVICSEGFSKNYHAIRLFYDDKNRVSRIEYVDNSGSPVNANIYLEDGFDCQKIEITYTGNRITEEKFYVANSNIPFKILDCLKNDYVATNGMRRGNKNR